VRVEDAEERALLRGRRHERAVRREREAREVRLVRGDDRRLADVVELDADVAAIHAGAREDRVRRVRAEGH